MFSVMPVYLFLGGGMWHVTTTHSAMCDVQNLMTGGGGMSQV